MTLRVEFDQFAATAKRLLGDASAYLARTARGVLVTAAMPGQDTLIVAESVLGIDDAAARLREAGLDVREGQWSTNGADDALPPDAFVAAIAYMSGDGKPGLWVDAFSEEITPSQALRAMHLEMTANGEVAEVPFDDFVRAANPNVVLLSPSQIQAFSDENQVPKA